MTIDNALSLPETTSILIAIGALTAQKQHVSDAEQTFLYIEEMASQVNNGGFQQFFYNYSGEFPLETLGALETIGATKTKKLLRKAIALFPAPEIPRDILKRRELIDKVDESISEAWDDLDQEFYRYEDKIEELLLKFVKGNREGFI